MLSLPATIGSLYSSIGRAAADRAWTKEIISRERHRYGTGDITPEIIYKNVSNMRITALTIRGESS